MSTSTSERADIGAGRMLGGELTTWLDDPTVRAAVSVYGDGRPQDVRTTDRWADPPAGLFGLGDMPLQTLDLDVTPGA